MIRALLFDLDDTLINTLETKISALQETARFFYQFELDEAIIKGFWGKSYHEFLKSLFLKTGDSLEQIIYNYEFVSKNYPARLYEDVVFCLPMFFQRVPVGIVTSARRAVVERDLRLVELQENSFFHIQTSDDTEIHKPDPAVFDPTLKKLAEQRISREEVLYVGDSLNDYFAAKGAGLHFVGLVGRTTSREAFVKNNVNIAASLHDLLNSQLFTLDSDSSNDVL